MKVLFVGSEFMGSGDDALGEMLIKAFFRNLCLCEEKPLSVVFYNGGVKLVSRGNFLEEEMRILSDAGVELIACGTCVNHFGLQESICNARIGNMQETVSLLMKDDVDIVRI